MALSDEKYILFTTFRRNGTPVATPVWVVELDDGELGFWTSSGSGKAKRLAHTPRVTIAPCDARGRVKPGAQVVEATAHLVAGSDLEAIRQRIVSKYGIMTKITKLAANLFNTLRGNRIPYADRGVVIAPSGSA